MVCRNFGNESVAHIHISSQYIWSWCLKQKIIIYLYRYPFHTYRGLALASLTQLRFPVFRVQVATSILVSPEARTHPPHQEAQHHHQGRWGQGRCHPHSFKWYDYILSISKRSEKVILNSICSLGSGFQRYHGSKCSSGQFLSIVVRART